MPSLSVLVLAISYPATAQIIPDNTLPVSSSVTLDDRSFIIEGGTVAGTNLFHSFPDFSIPTGNEAFFNNATTIDNIIARVTGSNISNIDGLIRANGGANLFLLNPNGIHFGPNARLDIGGSFVGTTANRIVFENGLEFSATDPRIVPLLSLSVPVGLQWNQQEPAAIEVRGNGHGFTSQDPTFASIERSGQVTGLQVPFGETLALVGGDLNLVGGTVTTESGRIELGAVGMEPTRVELIPVAMGWELNYDEVESFGNIVMSQQAAADASGEGGSSIRIVGRQVTLADGSIALIQTSGDRSEGILQVNATEAVNLVGANPEATVRSTLLTETFTDRRGADISVATQQLSILDGGRILASTFGAGDSGNVRVSVSESIAAIGFVPSDPNIFSLLSSATFASGNAGDIMVATRQITIRGGAGISAPSFSTGNSGNITVNATESIEVAGVTPIFSNPSAIAAASVSSGNAGTVTVNTSELVVRHGGFITTSALANGSAGNVFINATESIAVTGRAPGIDVPARIGSDASIQDPALRELLGIPNVPSGNAGSATIDTPRLIVSDGAEVTVQHQGTGRAGNLTIDAESIVLLNSEAGITASTASGEGGNITLNTDALQLRNQSQITTEAGGTGNGGNINLNVETISALENSVINANAFEGNGGNIRVSAEGLFFSEDSRITASSQLGIDGLVEIVEPAIDTHAGLVELDRDPLQERDRVVSGCSGVGGNRFSIIGRGGLPPTPNDILRGETVWEDLRSIVPNSERVGEREEREETSTLNFPDSLTEATNWRRNDRGTVELVAAIGHEIQPNPIHCQSLNRHASPSRSDRQF